MLPETQDTEFNATATFWLRLDRTFRIHATAEELLFIRIAGQTVDWAAALGQLGFVGVWLGRKLNGGECSSLRPRPAARGALPARRRGPTPATRRAANHHRIGLVPPGEDFTSNSGRSRTRSSDPSAFRCVT